MQSCGHDGLRELVRPLWTKELLPDLSEELALLSELAHLLTHRLGLGLGVGVGLGLGPPSQAAAAVLRPLACGARGGHASAMIRVGGRTALGGFRRERLAGEVGGRRVAG